MKETVTKKIIKRRKYIYFTVFVLYCVYRKEKSMYNQVQTHVVQGSLYIYK